AEDGIRDFHVTGVQTCALPILEMMRSRFLSHETEKSFAKESARGTADVTRQQLSQSTVGEMSRVARITASCFVRVQDGRLVCLQIGRASCREGGWHMGGDVPCG